MVRIGLKDSSNKYVLKLALPIVGTNILSRGPSVVDTAFVGHIGAAQLAGVGLAQLFIFAAQSFTHALAIAGTVMIAHRTGENNFSVRQHEGSGNFTISLIIGVLLSFIFYHLTSVAGDLMGATGDVHKYLMEYSNIFWYFFAFKLLNYFLASMFQGSGDSKTPLKVIGSINILNVILDYGLIFGKFGLPEMGVAGAAIATGIAETTGALVLYLIAVKRRLIQAGISLPHIEPSLKFAELGIPVLGERLLNIGMQLLFARMVIAISVTAYAAHQMGVNIEMISLLSGFAFMQTATALVGQTLGAKNPEAAVILTKRASRMSLVVMTILGLLLIAFPEFWVKAFTIDEEVIAFGKRFLVYGVLCMPLMAVALTYSGGLRGAGETKYVMYVSLLGGWIVRLSIAYILGFTLGLGLDGIWVMMPIDWAVRALFYYKRFYSRNWETQLIPSNLI